MSDAGPRIETEPARHAAVGYRRRSSGATVVLGVSGGIAAYKAVEVCRRLVDAGAHVVPVLTASATRFVGAATFSALASEPARSALFDEDHPIPHTDLGQAGRPRRRRAGDRTRDRLRTPPASPSDLLVATLLATRAPVLVCPAMHTEMWEHPAVQENLAILRRRGVHVLEPATRPPGRRRRRRGRLAEPRSIVDAAAAILAERRGRRQPPARSRAGSVLVTAGGTREPIDPVRYISNRSSGKQGHALAEAAARARAPR